MCRMHERPGVLVRDNREVPAELGVEHVAPVITDIQLDSRRDSSVSQRQLRARAASRSVPSKHAA